MVSGRPSGPTPHVRKVCRWLSLWHTRILVPVATARALILVAVTLLSVSARAEETSLLRVFLLDGTTLTSFGEYARVGDRIVFSMPLGAGADGTPRLQLVSLPERGVDWTRTDAYRDAARVLPVRRRPGENDFAVGMGAACNRRRAQAHELQPRRAVRRGAEQHGEHDAIAHPGMSPKLVRVVPSRNTRSSDVSSGFAETLSRVTTTRIRARAVATGTRMLVCHRDNRGTPPECASTGRPTTAARRLQLEGPVQILWTNR